MLMGRRLGRVLVLVLALMALVGGVLSSVADVIAGRGLEYYFTPTGVKMTPISALVIVGLLVLVVPAALAVAWWRRRRGSDSE